MTHEQAWQTMAAVGNRAVQRGGVFASTDEVTAFEAAKGLLQEQARADAARLEQLSRELEASQTRLAELEQAVAEAKAKEE